MSHEPLVVVGIGPDGPADLCSAAREHLARARVLAGGRRHLSYFPDWSGERIVLDRSLEIFLTRLRETYRCEKTVLLASGDPLFFGIGRALLQALPKEDLLFLPQVSSVQLAFARIKEPWQDARVVSLHGRPLEDLLPALIAREPKIAVLTDGRNHPGAVAGLLHQVGVAGEYDVWVCENLGGPEEQVARYSPQELHEIRFAPLNVVVLLRSGAAEQVPDAPLLGIPESILLHRPGPRGMITRREIRLIALCYLELRPGEVLWDVGAGSGSVALEAARLSPLLKVHAVEKDPQAFQQLGENTRCFGGGRVHLVQGEAPQALAELPDPDAVFVGGSGGRLREILKVVVERLRPGGRVVLTCITLENFAAAWEELTGQGLDPEATSVQLAHSRPLGRFHGLEPDNLIFVLRARKP